MMETKTAKPARQVLVFMVRGLFSNYNHFVGYEFVNKNCPASKIKEHLFCIIRKLQGIGLDPKAVVSDQGSNFISLSKLLALNRKKTVY